MLVYNKHDRDVLIKGNEKFKLTPVSKKKSPATQIL
jgi:hypothetical protein